MGETKYWVYMHMFPNGKRYIGITKDIKRRFRNGRGYDNQPIMRCAIKKYGWENVVTKVLYSDLTEKQAKEKEIKLIAELKTHERKYGYNQTLGGESANGRHMSEEQKRKVGERMSACNKGRHMSQEQKEKLSKALRGKPKNYTEEGRKRIIESNRTRVCSRETRKKISENTKIGMRNKNMSQYLSNKWKEEKQIRKAKIHLALYDRYGITSKNYDLAHDVVLLGLEDEYQEFEGEFQKYKRGDCEGGNETEQEGQ
jgi:group I intron endonuclease